jgi:hypothetical protein
MTPLERAAGVQWGQIRWIGKARMMPSLQPKPYTLNAEEGQFLQCLGATIYVKATSEQTGGVFNLFEVTCPLQD